MTDSLDCRECGHSPRSHEMNMDTLRLWRCNVVIAYERKGKVLCGCKGYRR